jgi:hypothetical protein
MKSSHVHFSSNRWETICASWMRDLASMDNAGESMTELVTKDMITSANELYS